MKSNKKKYYVVWEGNNMGVFNTWDECKLQTKNYKGAKYKSFTTLKEAEAAYSMSYYEFKNIEPKKLMLILQITIQYLLMQHQVVILEKWNIKV